VPGYSTMGGRNGEAMTTLRIEHAIHDYGTWQKAFHSFADARASAGVRSFAIRLPVAFAEAVAGLSQQSGGLGMTALSGHGVR
jgi:hypothetical protein